MQRTIVTIISDLSQEDGADTYSFGWDGERYDIDLTDVEGKEFAELIAPYIAAGRRVTVPRASAARPGKRSGSSSADYDANQVREWARENGYEISLRGRIPRNIIDAFLAAH